MARLECCVSLEWPKSDLPKLNDGDSYDGWIVGTFPDGGQYFHNGESSIDKLVVRPFSRRLLLTMGIVKTRKVESLI